MSTASLTMMLDGVESFAAVQIKVQGELSVVTGYCDGARLRKLLDCKWVQMVPCTHGELTGKYEIWCDEEGMASPVNAPATRMLGAQVHGGVLRGTVLLAERGFVQ